MGFGKAAKWSSGKESRAAKAQKRAAKAEPLLDDVADGADGEEPPLAQPARKRSRSRDAPRRSQRGAPEPFIPTPRGPPASKPQRPAAVTLSPGSLEKRRVKNREYAKTSYEKMAALVSESLPEVSEDGGLWLWSVQNAAVTCTGATPRCILASY